MLNDFRLFVPLLVLTPLIGAAAQNAPPPVRHRDLTITLTAPGLK